MDGHGYGCSEQSSSSRSNLVILVIENEGLMAYLILHMVNQRLCCWYAVKLFWFGPRDALGETRTKNDQMKLYSCDEKSILLC